jgi:hypothetical protein
VDSPRTRIWLSAAVAVVLVAGLVAWRVVAAGDGDGPGGHHAGPGKIVRPDFDVRSERQGAWTDPATWSGGMVPTAADTVEVSHTLRFDATDGEAGELWLSAPLTFARDRPTRLTMHGSLVVEKDGLLDVRQPNPARTAVLAFDVADEQAFAGGFDFHAEDIGLWVFSGGKVELHGAPVRKAWAELVVPARAGSQRLGVRGAVSDWPKGSEILVSGTNLTREAQHEVVRIQKAFPHELVLQAPLRFDHQAAHATPTRPAMTGEVGLLTHNVKVMSLDPKNRAHVFFYEGAGGGITYTQFDKMGPDNQFSRYALHFHVMEDSSLGMVVRGSSFRGSGTFWLNIHGSNGMTIVDNVGYQARGAGFYMEHPAGIGNTWLHNLGVDVRPSVNLQHRNAVFWFLLGNSLIDNVGVGAYGGADSSGFFLPQQPRDDPALDHPTVILHNEAHSNRQYGFASWMNLSPRFDVVDLNLWHNGDAGFHWGAYGTRFRAFRVKAVENGEYDVEARVKGLHLQDSYLDGAPVGMFFENPIVNTNPRNPSRIVRTTFAGHDGHDVAIDSTRECKRATGRCPPMYLEFIDSRLGSPEPVRFGWQWNAATRMWFQDVQANGLPDSFVLVREDQPKPSPQAVRDERVGAWVAQGETVLEDLPPTVDFSRGAYERRARIHPFVEDDGTVERIEVLLNGESLGEIGDGWIDFDRSQLPPWAFITLRAIDDAGNVAYSRTTGLLSQDGLVE